MKLHYLEKKYGIRINLLTWSGDNYETGTPNALIKISDTTVGQILLESIAYHICAKINRLLLALLWATAIFSPMPWSLKGVAKSWRCSRSAISNPLFLTSNLRNSAAWRLGGMQKSVQRSLMSNGIRLMAFWLFYPKGHPKQLSSPD